MVIYKTTNRINGKIYIGKDEHDNPKYLGSGKLLHLAIKKYGKENFIKETIEVCENLELLNIAEIYWIKKLKSQDRNIGYNIANGGSGGATRNGYINSEYVKEKSLEGLKKFRESLKDESILKQYKAKLCEGQKNRPPITEETRIKLSKSAKNRPSISEETRLKLKNKVFTKEHRDNLSKAGKDRVFSNEHKLKLRKPKSEEHKNKLSKAKLGIKNNTVWVYKKDQTIKIKKEQLDKYIKNGWFLGRIYKKIKNIKFVWVCKENNNPKRINFNELEIYLKNNWKRGRKL